MTEFYHPCLTGLHVCGATIDECEPRTERNIYAQSADEARRMFEAARAEAEALPGELDDRGLGDFTVDLFIGGDCSDDFQIKRQMLERMSAAARAVRS